MVKITRVYTRQGDKGETQLAGGIQIAKDSLRIQTIGEIDELNALIGYAVSALENISALSDLAKACLRIQGELFNLGSQLAVLSEKRRENTPVIRLADIERLEAEIDQHNENLPTLTSFILPGGGEVSVRFHMARTVCRRAERALVGLAKAEKLDWVELPYLNRLSDWLFVMARYVACQLGRTEALWQP